MPGNLIVDSSSSSALTTTGSASVTAAAIQITGGYQKGSSTKISPAPVTGVAAVPDPLGGESGPNPTGMKNYGAENLGGSAKATIYPGIYTSISVTNSAKLTLATGIYVIEGGGLTVSTPPVSSPAAGGVLIVNAGSNYPTLGGHQTYGGITVSNSASINLSPYTNTGIYAGLVIFQTTDNSQAMVFSGSATGAITGTIYVPAAALTVSNSAAIQGGVIVDTLTISGSAVLSQVKQAAAPSSAAAPASALTAEAIGSLPAAAPSGPVAGFRSPAAGRAARVFSPPAPIALAASWRPVAMESEGAPDGTDSRLFEDSDLLTDVAVSLITAQRAGMNDFAASGRSKLDT